MYVRTYVCVYKKLIKYLAQVTIRVSENSIHTVRRRKEKKTSSFFGEVETHFYGKKELLVQGKERKMEEKIKRERKKEKRGKIYVPEERK